EAGRCTSRTVGVSASSCQGGQMDPRFLMPERESFVASRRGARRSRRVFLGYEEAGLEQRHVLNAALAHLPDVSSLQYHGYQVVLDGSGSGATQQTYTVTSTNPDIAVSVAQGQFMTVNVSHASSGAADPAFTGTIVLQLFEDLTPTSAAKIESYITSGFYNG